MKFADKLKELNACGEATLWVGEKDLEEAWKVCDRADWMVWLLVNYAGKEGWSSREEVATLCLDIAESVLKYIPKCEDIQRKVIEVARKYLRGEASKGEVISDDIAAYYAYYAAYYAEGNVVYYAAYRAVHCAAYYAVEYAVEYAVNAVRYAVNVRKENNMDMSELIRKRLKVGSL